MMMPREKPPPHGVQGHRRGLLERYRWKKVETKFGWEVKAEVFCAHNHSNVLRPICLYPIVASFQLVMDP